MANMVAHSFSIGNSPVELHKRASRKEPLRLSDKEAGGVNRTLDVNIWLSQAAKPYNLSDDLRDYVLVPVPSIITSIPNTNGDSASLAELTRFMPDYGQMSYRTWVGKPTFVEHDNKDVSKAKGVILDTYLRPLPRYPKYAKLVKLLAWDRTKDPRLVDRILKREISTYSMGMMYASYTCSICGARVGKGFGRPCSHTAPRRPTYKNQNNQLAYRQCENLFGFETSAVEDPAYSVAQSDLIWDLSKI